MTKLLKTSSKPWRKLKPSQWALAGLLASVVLFGITQHLLFALTTLALVAASFYFETKESDDHSGDLLQSLALALGAWVVLTLILNSTSPVNIITSCSMLPDYQRGDLIVLAGGPIAAPQIQISQSLAGVTYESFLIQDQNGQPVARLRQPVFDGKALFEPQIGVCQRDGAQGNESVVCLKSLSIQGQTVTSSKQNSVVVYDSKSPAGLIIHRAFAVLNARDGQYVITKGDNNAFLDQQSGFDLIRLQPEQRVLAGLPFLGAITTRGLQSESTFTHKGNVLLRVPYIGYIKLLVFLQIQAPAGCDSVLVG